MDDREKITMLLERTPRLFVMYGEYAEAADFLIENGVATVVRCKNCTAGEDANHHCVYCGLHRAYFDENGFCSFGVAKT